MNVRWDMILLLTAVFLLVLQTNALAWSTRYGKQMSEFRYMRTALKVYEVDEGVLPATDEKSTFVKKIKNAEKLSGIVYWRGDLSADGEHFLDAWGNPIIMHNGVLRSFGANGINDLGGKDDLTEGVYDVPYGYYYKARWHDEIMTALKGFFAIIVLLPLLYIICARFLEGNLRLAIPLLFCGLVGLGTFLIISPTYPLILGNRHNPQVLKLWFVPQLFIVFSMFLIIADDNMEVRYGNHRWWALLLLSFAIPVLPFMFIAILIVILPIGYPLVEYVATYRIHKRLHALGYTWLKWKDSVRIARKKWFGNLNIPPRNEVAMLTIYSEDVEGILRLMELYQNKNRE